VRLPTFNPFYGDKEPHWGCFENLVAALKGYGVDEDRIPVAFNCFMNVFDLCRDGEIAG
jgi:uncharacterized protein